MKIKHDEVIGTVFLGVAVFLLGAQIRLTAEFKELKKPQFPTYAQIHRQQCDTCGCNNKADVYLVIDLGKGHIPLRETYMCNDCYTDYVVDMATPMHEVTIDGDGGRIKR